MHEGARTRWFGTAALALLCALVACGGGGGDTPAAAPTPSAPGSLQDPTVYSSAPNASLASAQERAAITAHTITLDGGTLAYTATAGHLNALDAASAAPLASMFYVAYTLDGADPAIRPIVFFYNGGPGSASVWLHIGSFGPRRVVTDNPSITPPQPYRVVDNAQTLLDTADLVFVDAVGTGYSQAIAPAINQSFWGVDADAAVMRDFIARYLAVHQRGGSPAFLFGESYGTTRSAVLANLMVSAGMRLDGVILLSSVLDYSSNCGLYANTTVSCAGYLPSYGMAGAWFGIVATPPASDDIYGDALAQSLRDYADQRYAAAVQALLLAPGSVPGIAAAELSGLTGAPTSLWQARFNLQPDAYRNGTLPSRIMGRYDARVAVARSDPLAAGGDPSSNVISGPFSAAQRAVFAGELLYSAASPYVLGSNAIATWDFSHDGRALPDTIPDLAAALLQRGRLPVLSLNGYHDLATPFHQTELDLERLGSMPELSVKFYPGGHMTYLDDTSRPRMKADITAFIAASLAP